MRDKQRTTSEDSATQLLICEALSLAIFADNSSPISYNNPLTPLSTHIHHSKSVEIKAKFSQIFSKSVKNLLKFQMLTDLSKYVRIWLKFHRFVNQ